MLSVLERIAILDEADALAAAREFVVLDQLLTRAGPTAVEEDPTLTYYVILAALQQGNIPHALERASSKRTYFERHQDSRVYRRYLNVVGILLTHSGNLELANQYFSQVFSVASSWDDRQLMADATMNMGVVADIQGRWKQALVAQIRALAIFCAIGDSAMAAGCYHNLGMTLRQLRRCDEARIKFDVALDLFQQHGTRSDVAGTALEKALLYVACGESDLAEVVSTGAYKEIRQLGNPRLLGEAQKVLGVVSRVRGQSTRARRYLERAYTSGATTGNALLQAEAAEELGSLFSDIGDQERQSEMAKKACEIYRRMGLNWRVDRITGMLSPMLEE